jgi:hypothetical protein
MLSFKKQIGNVFDMNPCTIDSENFIARALFVATVQHKKEIPRGSYLYLYPYPYLYLYFIYIYMHRYLSLEVGILIYILFSK